MRIKTIVFKAQENGTYIGGNSKTDVFTKESVKEFVDKDQTGIGLYYDDNNDVVCEIEFYDSNERVTSSTNVSVSTMGEFTSEENVSKVVLDKIENFSFNKP